MKNFIAVSNLLVAAGLVASTPVPEDNPPHWMPDYVSPIERRVAPAKCDADNCARAVTGTAKGLAFQTQAKSDCSAFLSFTYIPPTSTSTITVTPPADQVTQTDTVSITNTNTVTVTTTSYTDVEAYNLKRAEDTGTVLSPSQVPAYASPCSGVARYSSACSCWGVTARTTTLPSPVAYAYTTLLPATETNTISVTVTALATATQTAVVGFANQIPCGKTLNSATGTPYKVVCEAAGNNTNDLLSSTVVLNWDACAKSADEDLRSNSFTYELETKTCKIYRNYRTNFKYTDQAGIVFAYFYPNGQQ